MGYLDPVSYELPFASGSDTSEEAATAAGRFVGRQGQQVLAWLRTRGAYGATQTEACQALPLSRPSACARFHALEQQGSIKKTAVRRGGCGVYEAV